ncbi:TRAFs-binding domain-containing protein [Xanthomonadaceae bacterium JHOS43]|nr:TRAFs-binding domain-containing protein [Xanthomonadaceae bacterium JHOS43]
MRCLENRTRVVGQYLAAHIGQSNGLQRIGDTARALSLAMALLDDPAAASKHDETLALTGRIAKDRWRRLPAGPAREHAAQQAIDCYRRAWEQSGDIFPSINAATMLYTQNARDAARALAREVREAALRDTHAAAHWREATLGEAALLLGDPDAAAGHYAAAFRHAAGNLGDIASMRRQLRLIEGSMAIPQSVWRALELPRIVVFTGHMVDAPGRAVPRLPEAALDALAQKLATRLEALNAGIGYCSAACGADILFIEGMLARGAEVHVTLPFAREDFVATSVAYAGPAWVRRFERALARVASVGYGVREHYLGDESLYAYAGRLMQGAALLRGQQLESEPMLLAVLDNGSERLPGGTRDLLENWQRLNLPCERIDPAQLRAAGDTPPTTHSAFEAQETPAANDPPVPLRSHALRRQVRTMLFADMVGFSRLKEEDTPSFLVNFLGAIAQMLAQCETKPSFVNTWGDGLFMVFDDVSAGVEFALRLRDAMHGEDWPARGLPAGTTLRIGMHTGPVFEAHDPIIGRSNYFGSHVVRAARIEPVATPGAAYVSAELAYTLAASGAHGGFATDYLGLLSLAKSYGTEPLYRLRRAQEAE